MSCPTEVKTENTNEFAYLDRNDFTSERFKIELSGFSRFTGVSDLKKLFKTKLQLETAKIKKPGHRESRAYVCFRSAEDRDSALAQLVDYKWKGKVLTSKIAAAAPDPMVRKRKAINEDINGKKFKDLPPEEALKESATPYAQFEYEKQLQLKQDEVRSILKRLGHELYKANHLLQDHIKEQQKLHDGLPCELLEVRRAENINGYRTKCEFTVGLGTEDMLPIVGFRTGTYANGSLNVVSVDDLLHIPDCMKNAAKVFQKFVRNSKLPVFNQEFQSGVFKMLTARWSTSSNELMLIVGIQTKNIDEETYKTLKEELIEFFTKGDGIEAKATSLFIKKVERREAGDKFPKSEHLSGTEYIQEKILDLTFRISPEAFFQVNTQGAEVLYSSAIELLKPTENTTLVDVCCGTGTIGLCFAKHSGQVLGLEMIPDAVIDAKANAKVNGIENVEFFEGKAEDILGAVIKKAKNEDVIAVVDPPRAGLHQRAVITLRQCSNLNKILYMSCQPSAALKNFTDFGRLPSKTLHNSPFIPVKAIAVDLFPHTKHCELLVYFERKNLQELQSKLEELPVKSEELQVKSEELQVKSEELQVKSEKLKNSEELPIKQE